MYEDPRWPRDPASPEPEDWRGWNPPPDRPTAPYPPNRPQPPGYPPANRPPDRGWPRDTGMPSGPPAARWPVPDQAGPPPAPQNIAPTEHVVVVHERDRRRRFGWSLPIEHIVLAAGVAALWLAITQPWGVDARGHEILLSALAARVATYVAGAVVVLGGLLVLLNRRMGCLAMTGCLGLFALALVAAATVGGVTFLTQIHVLPQLTLANVKTSDRGFFLWWGGMAIIVVGLLLEVVTHRKRGLIGI